MMDLPCSVRIVRERVEIVKGHKDAPNAVMEFTREQAETLAKVILIKLGKMTVAALGGEDEV
jgi:hypothetical protein